MQQPPDSSLQPFAQYPQQPPPFGFSPPPQPPHMPYSQQPPFQPSQAYYPQQPPFQPLQAQQPAYSPPPVYAPPMQQPGQVAYPMASQLPYSAQPLMPNHVHVNVNVQQRNGPGFIIRALYFLWIGWWLGYIWLNIGFALCALIVTLPLGLMMLNRLPQIMTLKAPGTSTNVNVSATTLQQPMGLPGPAMMQSVNVNVNIGGTLQYNFLLRALYFIFIGSWAGYLWANLAYFCCATLVLLPVGVIMFDRLPMVLTLRRN